MSAEGLNAFRQRCTDQGIPLPESMNLPPGLFRSPRCRLYRRGSGVRPSSNCIPTNVINVAFDIPGGLTNDQAIYQVKTFELIEIEPWAG